MALSRRQFLLGGLGAGAAGVAGVALAREGGGHGHSLAAHAAPTTTPAAGSTKDGILVILTLYGGNDGLNTVIPYQDGAYLGGRAQLGYQPSEVLALSDGLALHPNLTGLKALWDAKQLAIVRGVGYPNPNRSHFRSMDIWQSAAPDTNVSTGWVGRWLDGGGTDPMRAVSIGGTLPRIFGGEKAAGSAVPVGALTIPGGDRVAGGFADLSVPSGAAPGPLAARAAQVGADLLTVDHAIGDLLASHPADASTGAGQAAGNGSGLDPQLGLVSQLIKAGSPTRVYGVSLSGFDTHANEKATHANLMDQLSKGVSGFFTGLAGDPRASKVVLVAYSEFGRRVAANASQGTDHGTAAPVFVAGPGVKGGFYGDEPSLTDLDAGDLKFTTDFRSVYATLLQDVIGVDAKSALGKPFTPVPFL